MSAEAINIKTPLVTLDVVRALRRVDSDTVLNAVCHTGRPHFMRWVFNVSPNTNHRLSALRFWRLEVIGQHESSIPSGGKLTLPMVIDSILGSHRQTFARSEIEREWIVSAQTIGRLVRSGELVETNHRLTRTGLAAFLERRLQ